MRASLGGRHVSGAERLVERSRLEETVAELLRRPSAYDRIVVTVEEVEKVQSVRESLPVFSYHLKTVTAGRRFALEKLVASGVPEHIARKGLRLLAEGPAPGGAVMRGAVLLSVESGQRLEEDSARGVRTVRVDWRDRERVREQLKEMGMTERTLDALALATKNVLCGVVAELCWSDDPDYTTGYVASERVGYVRIAPLKEEGDPRGGRIYFIRGDLLPQLVECLERKAVLIESLRV